MKFSITTIHRLQALHPTDLSIALFFAWMTTAIGGSLTAEAIIQPEAVRFFSRSVSDPVIFSCCLGVLLLPALSDLRTYSPGWLRGTWLTAASKYLSDHLRLLKGKFPAGRPDRSSDASLHFRWARFQIS